MHRYCSKITALIFIACMVSNGQRTSQIRAWIYRKLGIDPKIIQKIGAVRSGDERRRGKRLVWIDLNEEREHLLWGCGGCWAPAMANATDVAVLKEDGIWVVTGKQEPRLVVSGENLADLLGRSDDNPNRLLVSRSREAGPANCRFELMIADLRARTLVLAAGALPDSAPDSACFEGTAGLIHRDELMGNRRLSSTSRTQTIGPALLLLAGEVGSELRPLTPDLNARDSTRDRFDPIWRTATEVVYLSNPE